MKVRIEQNFMNSTYDVYIFEKHEDRLFVAEPLELKMSVIKGYKPGEGWTFKPTIRVDELFGSEFFTAFAKELSNKRFFPELDPSELDKALKAKDAHLEDMRKIAFQFLTPKGILK